MAYDKQKHIKQMQDVFKLDETESVVVLDLTNKFGDDLRNLIDRTMSLAPSSALLSELSLDMFRHSIELQTVAATSTIGFKPSEQQMCDVLTSCVKVYLKSMYRGPRHV